MEEGKLDGMSNGDIPNLQHCRNRQNLGPMKTRQIRKYVRKRRLHLFVTLFLAIFTILCLCSIFILILNLVTSNGEDNVLHPDDKGKSRAIDNKAVSKSLFQYLPQGYYEINYAYNSRNLLQASNTEVNFTTTANYNSTVVPKPLEKVTNNGSMILIDAFTLEQRRKGAVILHISGVIYMFIALAVACDEFFVPSLDVITNTLDISEDVAGATFMAAGGSAPELFTSVFGVFISRSDVGIGTIVGSAVFNILFVIGMCAIVSKGVLQLTWWPLFRDVSFYSISLICLICFFRDDIITWEEALGLLICYVCYVTFMKFNRTVEAFVKKLLGKGCSSEDAASSNNEDVENCNTNGNIINEAGHSVFRQGLIHLLLKSMDPLDNSRVSEAPMRLQAMTVKHQQSLSQITEESFQESPGGNKNSLNKHENNKNGILKQNDNGGTNTLAESIPQETNNLKNSVMDNNRNGVIKHNNSTTTPATNNKTFEQPADNHISVISNGSVRSNGGPQTHSHGVVGGMKTVMNTLTPVCDVSSYSPELTRQNGLAMHSDSNTSISEAGSRYLANGERDSIHGPNLNLPKGRGRLNTLSSISRQDLPPVEQPLDVSWPRTFQKRVLYILLAPIIIPLWITLPDVRKKDKKKWFPITFVGSVIWIGAYSYMMNWWTVTIGDTFGIPDGVMGLLFLSAGTSIPDLITSVIVARKGYGDMAVSSSVGSNIFDVTVGLPLPWLIYGFIFGPYNVNSKGILCSVLLLFSMLVLIIIIIAAFKWQMHKGMGASMFVMYIIFLCISLLLHYEVIPCAKVT